MQKEVLTRIETHKLVEQATGWRLIDHDQALGSVALKNYVKVAESSLDLCKNKFGDPIDALFDSLVLDSDAFPPVVLEAKCNDRDLLVGKEQTANYAVSQRARSSVLWKGNSHDSWHPRQHKPMVITHFPRQASFA